MRMLLVTLTMLLAIGTLAACGTTPPPTTPDAAPVAGGAEKTIFVAAETVPCTGVAPMDCLQIKESRDAEWQLYYDQIEGFTYEPGFEYELQVREEPIENPPADGSSRKLIFIAVVNRTPVGNSAAANIPADLLGKQWVLERLGAANEPQPLLAGTVITLRFEEEGGRITGSAGCNNYFAQVSFSGEAVSITTPGATKKLCPDVEGIMEQEYAYLQLLEQVESFSQQDRSLTLNAGDQVLIFRSGPPSNGAGADAPAPTNPLAGTEWNLVELTVGEVVTPTLSDAPATISFDPEGETGRYTGTGGCNRLAGSYRVNGDSISFEAGITTLIACPEPIMDQELQLTAALRAATRFEVVDDRLTIFFEGEGGNLDTLVFSRANTIDPTPPTSGDQLPPLAGVEWNLMAFVEDGTETPALPDASANITFDGAGRYSGTGGCNRLAGGYSISGDAITFDPGLSTAMACPEPIMDQELRFTQALIDATSFTLDGDKLTIFYIVGGGGRTGELRFVANTASITPAPSGAQSLTDATWRLVSLNQGGVAVPVLADTTPMIAFTDDGRVAGSGGCNRFFGGYTLDGNALTFDALGSTEMACEPEIMAQETAMLTLLGAVTSYERAEDVLLLNTDTGDTLVFERQAEDMMSTNELTGTAWKLTTLVSAGTATKAIVNEELGREAGFEFLPEGRVSGSGGCNVINASFTLDGDKLSFGPVMSTMMACAEDVMQQEIAFTQALEQIETFTLEGDTLTLSSADQQTQLIFERVAKSK